MTIELYVIDRQQGGIVVYKEAHGVMTNQYGEYSFSPGNGIQVTGKFDLQYLVNDARYRLELDIKFECNGEKIEESGVQLKVPWAANAESANSWDGYQFIDVVQDSLEQLDISARAGIILANPETKLAQTIPLNELLQGVTLDQLDGFELFTNVHPDTMTDFLQDHPDKTIAQDVAGNKFIQGNSGLIPVLDYPVLIPFKFELSDLVLNGTNLNVFRPSIPFEEKETVYYNGKLPWQQESKVTYNISDIGVLNHGFEVTISDPSTPDHNTAAGYFFNPNGTTGLLSEGFQYGAYCQGNNGVIGIVKNANTTGASVWGFVPQKPIKEQFAFALLGDANNFTSVDGVFGLGVYGDGFVTGNMAVGSLTETSDARLKESVHPVESSLDKVLQLQPKEYQFIKNAGIDLPEGDQIGFLAQDLEKIYPQLIREVVYPTSLKPDDSALNPEIETIKTINYSALIPILTKAIQELNAKVERQEQMINRLTQTITELKDN
ncbi:MAG: tail fiber domain-containing protein [Saprospiraceae bacterium]|nr:tail fiber domain-containing protein [Saprospiraceae bacterium]